MPPEKIPGLLVPRTVIRPAEATLADKQAVRAGNNRGAESVHDLGASEGGGGGASGKRKQGKKVAGAQGVSMDADEAGLVGKRGSRKRAPGGRRRGRSRQFFEMSTTFQVLCYPEMSCADTAPSRTLLVCSLLHCMLLCCIVLYCIQHE